MSPAPLTQHHSKSTGPRTDEGKRKSALNATRHGLTGRTVVMPYEDMEAYYTFCKELFEDLAPETALERQYAQTFCDTQWRLNRARSIEDSLYALGHFEAAGQIETEHPQVHAALTAARVFRDDSKSFVNISLYEQRLQRTLDKSLKQLQTLQSERKARLQVAASEEKAVPVQASAPHEQAPSEPATEPRNTAPAPNPEQFVFSTAETKASQVRSLEGDRNFALEKAA